MPFNAIETIIYMETSNPSNLPDGLKIFINKWGDQDDWDYHIETMQAEFQTQPHINPGQRGNLETILAQTLHIPPAPGDTSLSQNINYAPTPRD